MKLIKCHASTLLISATFSLIPTGSSQAYPTLNSRGIGMMSLDYGGLANHWLENDLIAYDGSIKQKQQNSERSQKMLINHLNIGAHHILMPNIGLRTALSAYTYKFRETGLSDGITDTTDRSQFVITPSMDVIFTTSTQVELFAGLAYEYHSAATERFDSNIIDGNRKLIATGFIVPRAGFIKRASSWVGGIYYQPGRDTTQSFRSQAGSEDSIVGDNIIYSPPTYGVLAKFEFSGWRFHFDISTLQASDGGPRTDSGQIIFDDHNIFQIKATKQFSPFTWSAHLIHKTLSYAEGAFTDLDTIPLSTFKLKAMIGGSQTEPGYYLGLVVSHGTDKQSLPQFNADYELLAYGLSIGWNFNL